MAGNLSGAVESKERYKGVGPREPAILSYMHEKGNLMAEETFRFRIDEITPESPRVKTFRLRPEGSGMPFSFLPGQHLGVRPAWPGASDPEHDKWRHFSLSGSPTEAFLEITVLNQGIISDRMHSLATGDWVETTRPVGDFVLDENVGRGPVFFAGGIGIAPVRSMIRLCLERELGDALSLFASFPTAEHVIYREEIKGWTRRPSRFSCWISYTGTEAKPDVQGSVSHPWDRSYLEERIRSPLERVYYLCAPRGLMDLVETHLEAMGVSGDRVRRERW
jgi:ferredoxin-NADP reductase